MKGWRRIVFSIPQIYIDVERTCVGLPPQLWEERLERVWLTEGPPLQVWTERVWLAHLEPVEQTLAEPPTVRSSWLNWIKHINTRTFTKMLLQASIQPCLRAWFTQTRTSENKVETWGWWPHCNSNEKRQMESWIINMTHVTVTQGEGLPEEHNAIQRRPDLPVQASVLRQGRGMSLFMFVHTSAAQAPAGWVLTYTRTPREGGREGTREWMGEGEKYGEIRTER